MSVKWSRAALAVVVLGLVSCARNSSTDAPTKNAPIPISTMSAHGTVHVSLSAPHVEADFDKATCSLALPSEGNGGLRITATSSGSPENSVVIVGSSVAHDGDVSWAPDGVHQRIDAPTQINLHVPDGVVFTGAPGSTTTLHVQAGGRSGTATFGGATYVSPTTVTDAAGTVSWTCS